MTRVFALILALLPTAALAQGCPEPLASATRLVVVAADSVDGSAASLQRYARATPDAPWRPVGAPADVLVGRKGLAWGYAFRRYARADEPVKTEGDKRAPAGFYRIGRPFGLGPSARPRYLHISAGMTCVDDVGSPAYNTITTRAEVGWRVHGENMWRVPEYRHGLLVDYPSDRTARAGSCIFIHLRLPDATGTSGCVAVPEEALFAVQDFAQEGAVLAVLSRQVRDRFAGCLPQAVQP